MTTWKVGGDDGCEAVADEIAAMSGELVAGRVPEVRRRLTTCGEDAAEVWHIAPDALLRAIEFNATALLASGDTLSFFTPSRRASDAANLVGRFSASEPPPASMVLTGANEAIIVLTRNSASTWLRLSYRCLSQSGVRMGSLRLSPATLALLVAMVLLFSCLCSVVCFAALRYRRARATDRRMQAMAGSVLLRHSELQQQRRRELVEALDRVERQTSIRSASFASVAAPLAISCGLRFRCFFRSFVPSIMTSTSIGLWLWRIGGSVRRPLTS